MRPLNLIILFGLLFLVLIQMTGTLIESIYVLDLLNTRLDAKVLGVLFLFSPALLLVFKKDPPKWYVWATVGVLVAGRVVVNYLETAERLMASGAAAAAALVLLPIFLRRYCSLYGTYDWVIPGTGLALAVVLGAAMRVPDAGIDASLFADRGLIGMILAGFFGGSFWEAEKSLAGEDQAEANDHGAMSGAGRSMFGLISVIALAFFGFSSPGVIARWTGESYPLIVALVVAGASGWALLAYVRPDWVRRIPTAGLAAWNLAFTVALAGLILSHTVRFPQTPGEVVVVEDAVTGYQSLWLWLALLLHPVIYTDSVIFCKSIMGSGGSLRELARGYLAGMLFFVILIFMLIFTNVWGYVEPVSNLFRNLFWAPYLLAGGAAGLIAVAQAHSLRKLQVWAGLVERNPLLIYPFAVALLSILLFLFLGREVRSAQYQGTVKVMTYNIQQANTEDGQRAYRNQLEVMRDSGADIIALQESDSARISLNNNDYVRYYAQELGYYSYYGPKTVTGTYGTALLSRYPIENAKTIFSYSDQDEIGTVEAEIVVPGRRFTIYNVHPDGSDEAMVAFARMLVERISGKHNVIVLGDFNLHESDPAYQLIAAHLKNAWLSVYPSGVDENGLDMSGDRRIDHIFVSPDIQVESAFYVPPPESHTDHPVHWAALRLK